MGLAGGDGWFVISLNPILSKISKRTMRTLVVIEAVNIVKEIKTKILGGTIGTTVGTFLFQIFEKGFTTSVVVRGALRKEDASLRAFT